LAAALIPLAIWWWRRSLRTIYLTLAAIFAFTISLGQGSLWSSVTYLAPIANNIVLQIVTATVLGLVVVLGWLWWQRDPRAKQLVNVVVIVGLAVGIYYSFFNSPGDTYSPSAIRSLGSYGQELVGRAILALGLGLIILITGLWWEDEIRLEGKIPVKTLIRASYDFVLLLAFGLIQALAVCYWRDGLVVTWYIPDLNWLFLHATTLAELIAVVTLGLALPVVGIGVI